MKAARLFLALGAVFLLGGGAALAQTAELKDGAIASSAPSASMLSPEQALSRFRQAELFERNRDLRSAFNAYTEAGEAGNGLAQKKLGDLYSSGNAVVERNYETALKWYFKAREQGIEIPKPLTYPATPVGSLTR
jgi:TPR repeat protein